jgi:hypothetical protein
MRVGICRVPCEVMRLNIYIWECGCNPLANRATTDGLASPLCFICIHAKCCTPVNAFQVGRRTAWVWGTGVEQFKIFSWALNFRNCLCNWIRVYLLFSWRHALRYILGAQVCVSVGGGGSIPLFNCTLLLLRFARREMFYGAIRYMGLRFWA